MYQTFNQIFVSQSYFRCARQADQLCDFATTGIC